MNGLDLFCIGKDLEMKFEHQFSERSPKITIELNDPDSKLEAIFGGFYIFLMACGYSEDSIKKIIPQDLSYSFGEE